MGYEFKTGERLFDCPVLYFSEYLIKHNTCTNVEVVCRNIDNGYIGTTIKVMANEWWSDANAGDFRIWKLTGKYDAEHGGYEGVWPD